MSAMSVLEQALDLDGSLLALPFVAGVDGALLVTPQCASCNWAGVTRSYTWYGRAGVAVACSLHTCLAPVDTSYSCA